MGLREILLAGSMLLSSIAFSQDKIKFDIYSKREGFLSPRVNNSSLKVDSNEIYFHFLLGIYSTKFNKINDSTYKETVKTNFFWKSKEEFFYYSFKDSCYTLVDYSIKKGKPREEKQILEGTTYNKKYKTLIDLFSEFEKGRLGDSIHFIALGVPYSVKIEINEKEDGIIYSCNLKEVIKEEPGDDILFSYPIEVYTKKENGTLIPLTFSTKFLNVHTRKNTSLEGELIKEKE